MRLPRDGRELITWPVTGAPDGITVEVRFPPAATWHPAETVTDGARLLVAGPDATSNPAGTVVLPVGYTLPALRVVAGSEVVVRDSADAIHVV